MDSKGLDFKHKEVISTITGKKNGLCTRCLRRS